MPLPQVLAGPILRRVTGTEVAVWIALREPATVELVVWAGPQRSTGAGTVESGTPPVARGTGADQAVRRPAPRRRGRRRGRAPASSPGAIHSYDVLVGNEGLRDLGLLRDEAATPGGDGRRAGRCASRSATSSIGCPRFVTPAPTIADLVLVQGSCRRTNADGPDAMAYLDDLIAEHRLDITRRPQQLFLTGDQIYADDLSGCLLPQVNAIGRELLGFTETLPIDNRAVAGRRSTSSRCSAAASWSARSAGSPRTTACTTCCPTASCWRCTCWCGARRCGARWPPPTRCSSRPTKVAANHLSDWEAYYAPKPGDPDADGLAKWQAEGRTRLPRRGRARPRSSGPPCPGWRGRWPTWRRT